MLLNENGQRVRKFMRLLSNELGNEAATGIKSNALRLITEISNSTDQSPHGLLFGQIQSGKTNNLLMSIALASDNGYRLFVILTSDNTWLYQQTLERTYKALPGLLPVGKDDWNDESYASRIESALEHTGLVIVATKNGRILSRLQTFIETYCPDHHRALIFDDEADQASLNTLINSDNNDLSTINQAIVDLREYFPSHVYIQVTATPQALFLQSADSLFAPKFKVMFDPGEGYVGGEAFFDCEPQKNPMRLFPDDEVENLTSDDSGDVETSWSGVPTGLRKALCSFFVGAATKLLLNEGLNYSCLCHISHKQDAHKKLESVVNGFITRITQALLNPTSSDREVVLEYLREAYDDLRLTLNEVCDFEDVCQEITDNIMSTHIQVLIAGSDSKPSYNAPFNILIGGNRLGRGVTIDRLLVTYYGRTTKAPQVDTLLQHARMYGYRKKELDAIRFYISSSLLEVFTNVYRSERQLRMMIQRAKPSDLNAIVLSRSTHSILRPTRTSVVYLDSLAFYMPGERYFPSAPLSKNIELLNRMLEPFYDQPRPMQVPIDTLIDIVNLTKSEDGQGGSWDDEAILVCLQNMKILHHNRGALVVRIDRDIQKGARAMLSANDYQLYLANIPTLTMYRYVGNPDKGWEDGKPRWVPNLRFPDGNDYFMFSVF